MARSAIHDYLQSFRFWAFDVPKLSVPPYMLNPMFAFSSITAPEITAEVEDVIEGNHKFPRKVLKHYSISTITFTRGVAWYMGDFYHWFVTAKDGGAELRRDIILLQAMDYQLLPLDMEHGNYSSIDGRASPTMTIPYEHALFYVPARAWYLSGCIPVRYKAASDFDATSSEVSIMELDVDCEDIMEISVGI